jgi:hypothetical protein
MLFGKFTNPFTPKELSLECLRESLSGQQANDYVGSLINSRKPFMVARIGSIELSIVKKYRKMKTLSYREKLMDFFLTWEWSYCWLSGAGYAKQLGHNAGFFPVNPENLNRFSQIMIESMHDVDLLGSWVCGEAYFNNEFEQSQICNLGHIDPFRRNNPWSQYLKGKKVLVIHPFANSIQKQYEMNREKIFQDPLVLPEFDLMTLPAVQSIAGNRPLNYTNWFMALDDMYEKAVATDAEIIIVGCGAYGFPLAAKLKRAGKQVIHLGGATQILFGIKGKRWDSDPPIAALYNEYWIRPSPQEYPPGASQVEGGCYW